MTIIRLPESRMILMSLKKIKKKRCALKCFI